MTRAALSIALRLVYDYVIPAPGQEVRRELDRVPEDFARTMRYRDHDFASRDDLLDYRRTGWIAELNEARCGLLDSDRSALSVTSGLDEHKLPLTLDRFLAQAKRVLRPGGRVLFVKRFNDNLATKCIDLLLHPAAFAAIRCKGRLTGRRVRVVRRAHGFRRSRKEIVTVARRAGLTGGYACSTAQPC